jgi:hypothetical protein
VKHERCPVCKDEFEECWHILSKTRARPASKPEDPVSSERLAIFISTPTLKQNPFHLWKQAERAIEYLGVQRREVLTPALTLGSLNPTVRLI